MLAPTALRTHLLAGRVLPAHPLALTAARTLDERRQCALPRYNKTRPHTARGRRPPITRLRGERRVH